MMTEQDGANSRATDGGDVDAATDVVVGIGPDKTRL